METTDSPGSRPFGAVAHRIRLTRAIRRKWLAIRLLVGALAVAAAVGLPYLRSVQGNDLRFWITAVYSSLGQAPRATADDVQVRFPVSNPLGVNTFLEQEVDLERRRLTLEMARQAGFQWVRQQFPWADLEPDEKGQFVGAFGEDTWTKYDEIVDLAARTGLSLIVRLDTSPRWAREGNDHPNT